MILLHILKWHVFNYLLLRCILKLGLRINTINRTVFKEVPIMNIKLYKITNINHESSFFSFATFFISSKVSLIFSMTKRNKYLSLSQLWFSAIVLSNNCTCYIVAKMIFCGYKCYWIGSITSFFMLPILCINKESINDERDLCETAYKIIYLLL